MPFTLSHPAAVLPVLSRSRSYTWKVALVVGAISPDFWFLLPGITSRELSHGRFGILIDPFAALFMTWVAVHWVLPRLARMPGMRGFYRPEIFRWGAGYLGALIGVATHLVWDQFTHGGSRVLTAPIFNRTIYQHGGMSLELFMLLWYANSLAGAVILMVWLRRKMRSWEVGLDVLLARQWILVGVAFVAPVAAILGWLSNESLSGPGGIRRALELGHETRAAGYLGAVCAFFVAMLAAGRNARKPSSPTSEG